MTTALSTSVLLPDVMALEASFVGRFAQGSGLEDLAREPYGIVALPFTTGAICLRPGRQSRRRHGGDADRHRARVRCCTAPISWPGSGLAEEELTRSWSSYLDAGTRIKATTGAYLIAHVQQIKDILIRTGLKPGEGLYFDQDSRVLVTSERFVRAFDVARQVRRHKLDARVGGLVQRMGRRLQARFSGHRAVRRLAGRATQHLGGAADARAMARCATARGFPCRLWRRLLCHPAPGHVRATRPWPGSSFS